MFVGVLFFPLGSRKLLIGSYFFQKQTRTRRLGLCFRTSVISFCISCLLRALLVHSSDNHNSQCHQAYNSQSFRFALKRQRLKPMLHPRNEEQDDEETVRRIQMAVRALATPSAWSARCPFKQDCSSQQCSTEALTGTSLQPPSDACGRLNPKP